MRALRCAARSDPLSPAKLTPGSFRRCPIWQVPLYVGSFRILRSMPNSDEWLQQMRTLLDEQGVRWAAPDFAGSRTALIAHRLEDLDNEDDRH